MHQQPQAPATPQAPAPTPIVAQDADLGAFRTQLADLSVERAGLKAQWDGLKSQLDNMLRNNPARPGVQQQWANVGVQLATVDGKIATLEARIAFKQGRPFNVAPRANPGVPNFPFVFPNLAAPAVSALAMVLLLPISIAWARGIVRRAPRPTPVPSDVTMRLDRIEQAVDTIAIEVERISEGQRFVTRLMAERPATPAAAEGSAVDKAMAQQPLMLGAGAMEPIVVPERDRVRQRIITPH
ncbi:MAG TPA: hypothetical protein VGQ44_02385 [Gemmatimonadaceae bacterium]|jgi:hypothetical protein|nr:hypothetical protein [Gemmatimonadaceae bacterium]